MKTISLRTKILVLVVLITSIPLAIVGYNNYEMTRQTVISGVIDQASAKVQNNADSLGEWLKARSAEVELMSRTDIVRFGSDAGRLHYFREETVREAAAFVTIGFADAGGQLTLSNGKQVNIAEEPSFKRAMKGESVVTDPFFSEITDNGVVVFQSPVFDDANRVVGVTDASILTERMYREHLNFHISRTDAIFLYNDSGDILHAPDNVYPTASSIYAKNLPFGPAASRMLGSRDGYIRLDGPEKESFLFYAKVPGTTWRIALQVPLHEFEKPLSSMRWRTVLLIAAAEAVIILLLFIMMNRIVQRIKKVLKATEAAAGGDFDVQAFSEKGGDEIAQLSQSVNDMRIHLRDMFGRLEAIINQNQFAFIVLDDQYRVTYFSQTAEKMLGYTAEEVLHKATALTFIDPDDLEAEAKRLSKRLLRTVPADLSVFRELRREQFTYEREWNYVRKDGTRFPVAHSSNGIRGRDGRFIGVAGVARDISAQKQAEKARSQQLEVMGAAKDLIATFDELGGLLYMNNAGKMLLGIDFRYVTPPQELISQRTIKELLHGLAIAKELGFHESEALLTTMGGKRVPVSKIVVAHRDNQTGDTFYSCIARDISEQKKAQAELLQAKREAEEANTAKGNFLARMSHEIRTPIAGIIGLAGLLHKTELNGIQQDYLGKVRASSEVLLRIINDILDFAKVEAGKIQLTDMPFDPWEMIHRFSALLAVFVGGKEQFEFIIEIDPDMPTMLAGDSQRLEQILLNLCINAIKFTERGHVRLQLKVEDITDDGRARILFLVEDTGIGMSSEQLDMLFEPFMQVDGAASRKYGGTGLGLVIVQSLVGMMGGTVVVDSRESEGSRFSFSLELPVKNGAQPDRYRISQSGELMVWVIEDYAGMSGHLCAELEAMGFLTMEHRSWKSAYERLQRAGAGILPNALLLDFEMPDMFGEDTWRLLHDTAKHAQVPTIALTTAFGREELLKMPQADRPDAIIVKPADRISLYQALLAVCQRPSDSAAADQTASAVEMAKPPGGSVLLAEDNKINQLVALEQLRDWGFKVEVAESGLQVLNKLQEQRWDLVLMDIHMPEMDGDEAARIIRQDSKYDRMPIIALTANIIREDHERYIRLGINDVLTKPIQPELMLQMIEKWVLAGRENRLGWSSSSIEQQREVYEPILAQEEELPPEVPGMDISAALARVNGKRDILVHMLKLFARDYAEFEVRLREALQSGDYTQARRMAHTLKGVAGNLSAAELAAMADQLETLLKLPVESRDPIVIASAAACVQIVLGPMVAFLNREK
ncbi:response regulator [Paenibacillus nasutitermitis]|uniref:Circadian input-output histidine kinase CikA n=1 Tax=Paenibacillus nasutitermitis TaxID=1652958 RepID=A0A917DZ85_9BACL|nr:response regulator [Paenibacillus nasutitermitis]GGD86558.1 hypothetical protein GCM10010911_51290 [Paenibacillus nasutitermitis]